MTTQIENINGIDYLVTRDGDGNIMRQAAAVQTNTPKSTGGRQARQLLANVQDKVFRDGQTLTALERDRVLVATLTILVRETN